jgi:hypothetical protein
MIGEHDATNCLIWKHIGDKGRKCKQKCVVEYPQMRVYDSRYYIPQETKRFGDNCPIKKWI